MQLTNILFRMGGAAVLLSTSDTRARFRLSHVVRTVTGGARDSSYRCIFQEADGEGNIGVNLSKDLLAVAGDALTANITAIAPLVLPLSEQLLFALSFIAGKVSSGRVKPYRPDFRRAFDHFCIHAGGRAVIDKVQRSLGLSDQHVEPSRMSLHRFGNTSSSSLWYELAYVCRGHGPWVGCGRATGCGCSALALGSSATALHGSACVRRPSRTKHGPTASIVTR
jgi:3-ketoacyl-CoA synthase